MKFFKVEANKAYLQGEWDKAIDYFKSHCINNPRDFNARLRVAGLLERSGRNSEATAVYRKLADDYSKEGFLQQAISVRKIILRINPLLEWVNI
jgi:tetratricopeptide (TPR) repeat protein